MDRNITTFGSYVYAPASSITTQSTQFEGINDYQSAPPLRHLPIPPEHSLQGNNISNNSTTMINPALTYNPTVSNNSAYLASMPTPNYQTSSSVNVYHNRNLNPIRLPPSHTVPAQTQNKAKAIQNATSEKKRWNTADFRWMFTKRNGSIGEFENSYQSHKR